MGNTDIDKAILVTLWLSVSVIISQVFHLSTTGYVSKHVACDKTHQRFNNSLTNYSDKLRRDKF